jgi:hypothetical protein
MTEQQKLPSPEYYQLRVKGQLDPRWSEWFEGLTISHEEDGSTLLAGPVMDQAALYGILLKLHDLNLPLLSVNQGIERKQE